jgi:hypothetical protein
MPYYIPDYVSKTTCIGNTLSTFNTSFSNLDTRLFQLSTYSVNSVNFLSSTMISVSSVLDSRVNFLSSTMISVSSDLRTQIFTTSSDLRTQINTTSSDLRTQINTTSSDLRTQIDYVSANVVNDYVFQNTVFNGADGSTLTWNVNTRGNNIYIPLSSNIRLDNPTGLNAGDSGNIAINISVAGKSISSYGSFWTFNNGISTVNTILNSNSLISYYYNGTKLLASLSKNF